MHDVYLFTVHTHYWYQMARECTDSYFVILMVSSDLPFTYVSRSNHENNENCTQMEVDMTVEKSTPATWSKLTGLNLYAMDLDKLIETYITTYH